MWLSLCHTAVSPRGPKLWHFLWHFSPLAAKLQRIMAGDSTVNCASQIVHAGCARFPSQPLRHATDR